MPDERANNRRDDSFASNAVVPMGLRLSVEIPKPKDWQAFQRNCVVLFRAELRDPNAKEYGRNGQDQSGIDLLGYRNADPTKAVGVQCRKIGEKLKKADIEKECRAALKLDFRIREMIFATTVKDDTKTEQAAKAVERMLREEGHELIVNVYGWGQLETLISIHDAAYNAFVPLAVATIRPVDLGGAAGHDIDSLAALIADKLSSTGIGPIITAPAIAGPDGIGDESPTLHAKIDMLRDLVKEGQPDVAEPKLIALRDSDEARNAPWARYRIETNIAAAVMARGREAEGAEAYFRAHAIRPDDPNALSNLAIAHTIQGRPDEGMRIAREVLQRDDRTEFAVSAMLQSASRSGWQGDPETLIPVEMRGTPVAVVALADFKRKRWLPGWEREVLTLPDSAEDRDDVSQMKALAVLSIAVDSRMHVVGGSDTVTDAQVDEAATAMHALARSCLRIGFADRHDLMAHLSNASLLLRLARRNDEAESLLRDGMKAVPGDEQLVRLLAMVLVETKRRDEALQLLDGATEAETVLMAVQFARSLSAADRLQSLQKMTEPEDERVAGMRRRLMAECALRASDHEALDAIVDDMLTRPEDAIAGRLLRIEGERKKGLGEADVKERLLAVANDLTADIHPIDRFLVAEEMLANGLEGEAADLIEAHIDLDSPRPATLLFLTALAESRRDAAYRAALLRAGPAVSGHPDMLWLDARHAWNAGDLRRSLDDLDSFLAIRPDLPRAVLMRIEVLIRLSRSTQILEALEKPIEDLDWGSGNQPFRVASLLMHFGQQERAARLAYRLFLEHRDKPRAWMTLSSLTIREGQDPEERDPNWSPTVAGPDIAVDVEFNDGMKSFFIIEPDPHLRSLDPESWEPDHALARTLAGKAIGDRFVGPDGREGRIAQLRHKIVARFHYVLANYETRFPEVFGFRSMSVDAESPNGLDELIAQLKERHDWVIAEQDMWLASEQPLGVLAARIGVDTIDVGIGLAQQGIKLRVAAGVEAERQEAESVLLATAGRGCALDLATFWTAWRLKALDEVAAVCGPVSIPRSVVDRLQAKRAHHATSAGRGNGSISYLDGKILHTEATQEQMAAMRDDIDAALAWIEENEAAKPLVLSDALPEPLRRQIQAGINDMLDATILSLTSGSTLVSDDLSLRMLHGKLGGGGSAWLHAVLTISYLMGHVGADRFADHTVNLIEAGQKYLAVSGALIVFGMEMDVMESGRLGHRSAALVDQLGGVQADPMSHIQAVCGAMGRLWATQSVMKVRERGASMMLEAVLRDRTDWAAMLKAIERFAGQMPAMRNYVREWARGHFLPGYV